MLKPSKAISLGCGLLTKDNEVYIRQQSISHSISTISNDTDSSDETRLASPSSCCNDGDWQHKITNKHELLKSFGVRKDDVFFGGEDSVLGFEIEREGVRQILLVLSEDEKKQMPNVTMPVRYLRSTNGDVAKAVRRIRETLRWRSEFQIDRLLRCMEPGGCPDIRRSVETTNQTKVMYVRGYDAQGRAIVCVNPTCPKPDNLEDVLRHVFYNVEKAIQCTMRKSVELTGVQLEQFVFVADYTGFQRHHALPISWLRKLAQLLDAHYPGNLCFRAFAFHPPTVLKVIWTLVKPFVSPELRERLRLIHDDYSVFTKTVTDTHKLEPAVGGPKGTRGFDSAEYLRLPFDVSFDE